MGNFFGFINYSKPGPGVPKYEPPKPRIIVFFQVYIRKFWSLVKLNILFSLWNLPALLPIILIFSIFAGTFQNLLTGGTFFRSVIFFAFSTVFLSIPVITTGPAQAGFTYVLTNYCKEEHAFIWLDFKEHAVKNFKQSLLISVIDFFVLLVIFIDFYIYANEAANSLLISISICFVALLLLIFLMMHLYIYPMMVNFKLSLKHIYKNAFIFAMVKFLPNVGILILCFVFSVIPILIFPIIGVILFPLITLSSTGLITNFYVYPTLKKYMMNQK